MKAKLFLKSVIIAVMIAGLNNPTLAAGRSSIERELEGALAGGVIPNSGDKIEWIDGIIVRMPDGSIQYESTKTSYSNTIRSVSDIYKVASHNPNVAAHFVNHYGINLSSTEQSYKNFNDRFHDLTSRGHGANQSINISPPGFPQDFSLNFDEDGIAKTVTMADGQVLTIEEFKRTNAYAAMAGTNDVGPLTELEREFSIASIVWGVKEKGSKECKATGRDIPPYMKKWHDAVKEYHTAEIEINKILVERMAKLDSINEKLKNTYSDDYQVQILKLQVEAMNMSIDALSGSNTFMQENKFEGVQGDAKAGPSRIAAREKLYENSLSTLLDNEKDKLKFFEAYKLLQDKIVESYDIAKRGCSRISIVEECTESETGEQSCVSVEKSDPVQGSCEMVEKFLPVLENGPFYDYAKIYFIELVPSAELNNRMAKLEQIMEYMYNEFPNSGLAEFNWRSPLEQGYSILKARRLEQGLICSASNPEPIDEEYKKIPLEVADYLSLVLGQNKGVGLFEKNRLMVNSDFKLNFTFDGVKYDDPKSGSKKASDESGEVAMKRFLEIFENPKNIDDYRNFYLAVFAIKDLPEDKIFQSFLKNWFQTDQVIGQSGQRGFYINYAVKVLDDTIAMDKAKLAELKEQKEMLLEVIKKVEEELNQARLAKENSDNKKGRSNVSMSRGGTSNGAAVAGASGNQVANSGTVLPEYSVTQQKFGSSSGFGSQDFLRGRIAANSIARVKNQNGQGKTGSQTLSTSGDLGKSARSSNLLSDIDKTRKGINKLRGQISKRNPELKKLSDSILSKNKSYAGAMSANSASLKAAYTPPTDEAQRIYRTGLNSKSKDESSKAMTGSGKVFTGQAKYKFGTGGSSSSAVSESRQAQENYGSTTASESPMAYGQIGRVEFDESSFEKNELFDYISKMYQNVGMKRLGLDE